MNNSMVVMIVVAVFVAPVAFVLAMNFDQIVGEPDPNAKPQGTLLYFYAST